MNKFNYLITGKMASGKDTACSFMPNYIRKAFADELKTVVKSLFLQGVEETYKHLKFYFQDDKGLYDYLTFIRKNYKYDQEGKNREILQMLGSWCREKDKHKIVAEAFIKNFERQDCDIMEETDLWKIAGREE